MKKSPVFIALALTSLALAPACGGDDDDDVVVNPPSGKIAKLLQDGRSVTIQGGTTWRDIESGSVTLNKGAVLTIEDGASIDIDEGNLVVNAGASIVIRGEDSEIWMETGDVTANSGALIEIEDKATLKMRQGSMTLNGASVVVRGDVDVKKDLTLNAGSSLDVGLKGHVDVYGDMKMNAPDAMIHNLNEFYVGGTLTINSGTFHNGTDDTSVQRTGGLDDYDVSCDFLELNGGEARFINYDPWVAYIFRNLSVNSGTVTNQGKMTAVSCTINGGTVSEGICPAQ